MVPPEMMEYLTVKKPTVGREHDVLNPCILRISYYVPFSEVEVCRSGLLFRFVIIMGLYSWQHQSRRQDFEGTEEIADG
jgi:hypothetical protein